ncbi:penicillin-binding protein 1A [Rickettsia endosymbiont of Cardiosporidium cionae]|uniref:penicillin-binding protein 1A n=1 Tax=Rickettsia endosymbiont of Cardiosporidium cionae TaxID=2777155 RepID=UPI0018949CFC|nr:PBP1A family penicillin-binding protein [Rickettsia endosymbiont of Cardiosporidium cionae]KAF8818328.1 penicillin-binding protein 1A [Rickettsia endosymbiont of Cardiosporidium cionae]
MLLLHKLLKWIFYITIIIIISTACTIYYYSRDLPDYSTLKQYHPPSVTRIYSADGKIMKECYKDYRIFVPISNIPKLLKNAFIAAEDKNFYEHKGVDVYSITRALINNIKNLNKNVHVEGGSTITQQVIKTFLLSPKKSLERKIKEAILAYKISNILTKDEILELYLNQVYLGNNSYGVAAAALNYFNKSLDKLTLNEAALLAALPKSPSRINPIKNYDASIIRKNYVIGRMLKDGYVEEQSANSALNEQITISKFIKKDIVKADYYASKVMKEVVNMFGQEFLETSGITIITCMDSKIQQNAQNALYKGIKNYDKNKSHRGIFTSIPINNWKDEITTIEKPAGIIFKEIAVVLDVTKFPLVNIGLENGDTAVIDISKTKIDSKIVNLKLKIGDVIFVEKLNNDFILKIPPLVNGAIIAIEPKTGRVLALEGGYDFNNSQFDRATQAERQSGSLIKTFIVISALERGFKPNDIFDDEYIEIYQNSKSPMWIPKNHDDKFLGPITMRSALEKSRNAATIRIAQAVGMNKIITTLKKFSISNRYDKLDSVVLGTINTTLEKITTGYAIIANQGRKIEPHYIELIKDRKGNIIYKRDYKEQINLVSQEEQLPDIMDLQEEKNTDVVIQKNIAYQITSILEGAFKRRLSKSSKLQNKYIAGKTGTTNNSMDAWFIGFTPRIATGVYIGFDTPHTLGKKAFGTTLALPIFTNFMTKIDDNMITVPFKIPDSIKLIPINPDTGSVLPNLEQRDTKHILESFTDKNLSTDPNTPVL